MYRQARVAERRPPRAPRVLAPSVRGTEVVVLLLAAVAAPVGRNICAVAVRVVALLGVNLLVERRPSDGMDGLFSRPYSDFDPRALGGSQQTDAGLSTELVVAQLRTARMRSGEGKQRSCSTDSHPVFIGPAAPSQARDRGACVNVFSHVRSCGGGACACDLRSPRSGPAGSKISNMLILIKN